MTALSAIYTGGRITAAAMRGITPAAVIKGLDQTASGGAWHNDDALYLPVAASATYLFSSYIYYSQSVSLNFQWLVPSGAALRFALVYRAGSGGNVIGGKDSTTYLAISTGTAITMTGTLVMSVTAGSLQFQFQNDTSLVKAQSFLALWRIS
jgi:hypothetical protein